MHGLTARPTWNRTLMRRDQTANGWSDTDLAREAACHQTSVGRFFAGTIDSPRLGRKLALALGHPVERYLQVKKGRAA